MKKLFVPGTHGAIKVVEVLGPNPNIKNGIYIQFEDGGTDTTWERFLRDIPSSLAHTDDLKPSKGDYRLSIGDAVESAAEVLGAGHVLSIAIEKGGYGVELGIDDDDPSVFCSGSIVEDIQSAISHSVDMQQPS
mgnify:CR=1 FL=1